MLDVPQPRPFSASRWLGELQRRPMFTATVLVLILCGALSLYGDRQLAVYIHQHSSADWRWFWQPVTDWGLAGRHILVTVILITVLHGVAALVPCAIATRRLRDCARYGYLLLMSLAVGGLVVNVVKPLLGRLRPRYLFEANQYGLQPFNFDFGMNSFPSGHSQTIWTASTVVVLALLRARIWLRDEERARGRPPMNALGRSLVEFGPGFGIAIVLLVAGAVALIRHFVDAHYLSDVIAGSYVGLVVPLVLRGWVLR